MQNLRHLLFLRVLFRAVVLLLSSKLVFLSHHRSSQVPLVIFTDSATHAKVKPYLHAQSIVELVEVSDLPSAFPFWAQVEDIRIASNSSWRRQQSASNPATRPNYNAVVMMKCEPSRVVQAYSI